MLRLIVKGTPEQATNAALARGIPFSVSGVTQIPTHPATVGYVEESYKPAVIAWFCEDEHMPFPAGTLLLYQVRDSPGQPGEVNHVRQYLNDGAKPSGLRQNMSFSTVAVEPTATGSCWIDTDGKFFPVEYTYHDVFAREMCELRNIQQTGWPVGALEDAGWLHVSNSESKHVSREGIRIEMERRRPSDAQIQTVWDWAIAHSNAGREDWADAIIKWISNYEQFTLTSAGWQPAEITHPKRSG